MWPISPADVPVAAPQPAALHQAAADARADADIQCALGLAGRAEPGLAQGAEVAVVADDDGGLEAGLQQRSQGHARQTHVRRHHHDAPIGIDHAGHGDADGRQVVGADAALADHVVHALLDGGHDPFGPLLARRGAFLPADDLARLAHQRALHLRAAHVHAQIQPLLVIGVIFLHGNLSDASRSHAPRGNARFRTLRVSADLKPKFSGRGASGKCVPMETVGTRATSVPLVTPPPAPPTPPRPADTAGPSFPASSAGCG